MKVLASNKKAYFNFDILDKVEAGIILEGWEVKSVKGGRIALDGAYIKERNGAVYLEGASIPRYKFATSTPINEKRDRKLLLHRKEILKLQASSDQKGATIIPLEVIQNDRGLVKVVVALVKGRKKFDKRSVLKEKDMKRRIEIEHKQIRQ